MLTAYVVIGIVMLVWSLHSVLSIREIDSADIFIAFFLFGVLWPVGVFWMLILVLPPFINKIRGR